MVFKRGLAVVGAAALFATVFSGEAMAAQGFDIRTSPGGEHSGWASARGSVTFHNAGDFTVSGTATDHCNSAGDGDGAGAYLYVQWEYANGDRSTGFLISDENRCDTGPAASNSARYNTQRTVDRVRVRVRECNRTSGGAVDCSESALDSAYSTWKVNPN